jgi:Flp pilus assembly protein TadG
MIASKLPKRHARSERGQAILEFAPVALLLLTMTFAVIDFGYYIWQNQVIIGLSREGSNLASRDTTLPGAAAAVIADATTMHLNLLSNGKVIVTSVQNTGTPAVPAYVITGQYVSSGTFNATSKVGTYSATTPKKATIPAYTPAIPQPGATLFITEIYCSFSGITPLTHFVKYTMPTQMYDVAYF